MTTENYLSLSFFVYINNTFTGKTSNNIEKHNLQNKVPYNLTLKITPTMKHQQQIDTHATPTPIYSYLERRSMEGRGLQMDTLFGSPHKAR